uniref:Uncharacterized protein n=1 Tax=Trypanosoma congolense (strain IL3000) TaxID=1068625 RepID=G0UKJ2_TRYCI|nr:conserved hypothetical protein [Trypanosoma congolense IL3000]
MPLWKNFITTKPEVDDSDLPLSKHRIYDDDGNLKPDVTKPKFPNVNLARGNPKVSPKKASLAAPKASSEARKSGVAPRNALENDVVVAVKPTLAKATSPAKDSDGSESAQPTPRKAPAKKVVKPTLPKATSAAKDSDGSKSAQPTPGKAPASQKTVPKNNTPSKGASSPKQGAVGGKVTGDVAKKEQPKKGKATKKAVSPKGKKGSSAPSKSPGSPLNESAAAPSPKWTVDALRAYASKRKIVVPKSATKADILSLIGAKK